MVDSQFAPLADKIAAAIKQISDGRIRFLINTHVHGDHTGGNEAIGKTGAVLMAREHLRERLAKPAPGANGQPGAPGAARGAAGRHLRRACDDSHGRRGCAADSRPGGPHRRRHDGLFPQATDHDRRLLPLDRNTRTSIAATADR